MNARPGRQPLLRRIAPLFLGVMILGVALILGYVLVVKRYLGGLAEERREAEDYARRHIELWVNEHGDPSGMWYTIPVTLTIYNSGPRDLLKLTVLATFRDDEDNVVWSDEVLQEIRLASDEERTVVWKFMIGRLIGSDVERATRIRTVEIEAVRAWTHRLKQTAPDERPPDPDRRLSRSPARP